MSWSKDDMDRVRMLAERFFDMPEDDLRLWEEDEDTREYRGCDTVRSRVIDELLGHEPGRDAWWRAGATSGTVKLRRVKSL